ncbi:MAG: hypothetical protein ACXWXC_10915 [Aeromicrobium sp.]
MIEVRWRGAAIDRLLDEDHARLVASVATWLRGAGWLVEVEVTYSEFGERGSFDILAFHPASGNLLVIEVKTELGSAEAALRKVDEKERLATKVARERFGWAGRSSSRMLVMVGSATARRQVQRHASLFERALPDRTAAVKRWVRKPTGRRVSGLWFFASSSAGVAISGRGGRQRVRAPKSGAGNHVTAI